LAVRAARHARPRLIVSRGAQPPPACRSEYQRNKDAVVAMLLQVVMNIDNPYHQTK